MFDKSIKQSAILIWPFLLVIYICFCWSIKLDWEWGNDFGVYYPSAAFLSEKYRLYKEHFCNKGPVYYTFLLLIGKFVGFGPGQAIFSLFLTALFFASSILLVARKYIKNQLGILIVLLIVSGVMYPQSSNTCVSFFQAGFLVWVFHFLVQHRSSYKRTYLVLAILFWALAVLTRIDAVVLAPVFLLSRPLFEDILKHYMTLILIGLSITLGLFVAFMLGYGYSFEDYYLNNIGFNQYHRIAKSIGIQYFWLVPDFYKHLLISGIPLPLFLMLQVKARVELVGVFAAGLGICVYLISNADRPHLAIMAYTALIFLLIVSFSELRKLRHFTVVILALFLSYPLAVLSVNLVTLNASIRDGRFLKLNNTGDLIKVEELKKIGEGNAIFERGWIFLFADLAPTMETAPAKYNSRYNMAEHFFERGSLGKTHEDLINSKGRKFLFLEAYGQDPNRWVKEIYEKSRVLKRVAGFEVRQIK